MLHQPLHHPIHRDPFHYSSSSPEKAAPRSHVATRVNPYTVKSQNTQFYASLRSAATSVPLDPRLTSTVASRAITATAPLAVDSLYSSLEAATVSPRCTSKPPPLPSRPNSKLTMVKPKPRPVKALALNVEEATAKRLTGAKGALVPADKRRRSVNEAAKQHSRSAAVSHSIRSHSRSQTHFASSSPTQSASPESPVPSRLQARPASKLVVPRITIRAATPVAEPSLDVAAEKQGSVNAALSNHSTPLYRDDLLIDLAADFSKIEDGIDSILSKYFDIRKAAPTICTELLRYLATSLCRLYCCVRDPESDAGQLKLRAISSHLFKHTVTGFIHLLDDPKAPYATASNLSLVTLKVKQDFDTATDWCCRVLNGPLLAQQSLEHGELFLSVLNAELDSIFDRGVAMTNMHNKLDVPGKGWSFTSTFGIDPPGESDAPSRPGSSTWQHRRKVWEQWIQEGDERNRFVSLDVLRFVGQLVLSRVVGFQVLAKWLDRFLVHTVHLGIPSAWEIECACALLLSVGAMLDRQTSSQNRSSCGGDKGQGTDLPSSSPAKQDAEQADCADVEGLGILNSAMQRVDRLIAQKELSPLARSWLVQLRQLRERGWKKREDEAISLDDDFDSD
ncbi:hypothetical protein PHSY_007459 [Pseudozyma hubeiensis SY62]|uniref:MIF4G domain-containing protein n=1 Tax=Pseudozyma hubeiensis (strain SY62) TaxID=1305764 RepID=R9PEU8_PSEHS|nr:hypothetical protein PHSY_007459 [Pseudozyma hubeiensis SY62]GAC99856.1 hypothetical protein PHSY_007459 [Pseudozyma hubeiensis SY62]